MFITVEKENNTALGRDVRLLNLCIMIDRYLSFNLSFQIESRLVGVTNRTQQQIVHLMQTIRMSELSDYCYQINSILDICQNYQNPIKECFLSIYQFIMRSPKKINEEKVMQQLANIAMAFGITCVTSNNKKPGQIKKDVLGSVIYDGHDQNQLTIHFNVEIFFEFSHYDTNKDNVEKTFHLVYDSMSATLEKKKTWASSTNLKKVKLFNQRWFKLPNISLKNSQTNKI